MKKNGNDLTEGSIPKHLLTFAMPLVIGTLLYSAYSVVDAIWVGNLIGEDAVAAIAVNYPVLLLLIAIASGTTMATSILVAQYYGAKDYTMVKKVVNNSFTISLIMIISVTIGGIFAANFLLKAMDTPVKLMNMASDYMKITFASFAFTYLFYLITSILRGIGDTIIPMLMLTISTVINIILDPLLIKGVWIFPKLGLSGAALASLISQFIITIVGMFYMNYKYTLVKLDITKVILNSQIVKTIFKIGFPFIVQQSLVSIGTAFITTFINGFGASATAAFGAVSRIESLAMVPAIALSMAVSAITGQNMGANKVERVKEIFKWGVIYGAASTAVISMFLMLFPNITLLMFIQDKEVLAIGIEYLRIVSIGYILFAVMYVSNGIINGAGYTITTMIFTFISYAVLRVPIAAILSKTKLGLSGIWVSILVSYLVVMTVSVMYYRSGKWKKPLVSVKKNLVNVGE